MTLRIVLRNTVYGTVDTIPAHVTFLASVFRSAVVMTKDVAVLWSAVNCTLFTKPPLRTDLLSRDLITFIMSFTIIPGRTVTGTVSSIPVHVTFLASVSGPAVVMTKDVVLLWSAVNCTIFTKPVLCTHLFPRQWMTFIMSTTIIPWGTIIGTVSTIPVNMADNLSRFWMAIVVTLVILT